MAKPVFATSHTRACSTAFERVFLTRRDILECIHEPFGDAWYYGPERVYHKYEDDEEARIRSGFSNTTFKDVLDAIDEAGEKSGKRVFLKEIAHCICPMEGKPTTFALSLGGGQEPGNPTIIPRRFLEKFQWTFLIRNPSKTVPSYYRCCIPPLSDFTGYHRFDPGHIGYSELRLLFDYLVESGIVPKDNIVVLDADDMLDKPEAALRKYCEKIGIDFTPSMLQWSEEDTELAQKLFAKWKGWHEDALTTSSLRPRDHARKTLTVEEENKKWEEQFGKEGQEQIRASVDKNMPIYNYLKTFALTV